MKTTIIIVAIITLYSAYVIRKKYKNIKNKKFCSCGCDGCSYKNKCH